MTDRMPTGDLRDRIAEALALQGNGPASDGRGWYRSETDRAAYYAIADAVLPVFEAALARARASCCEDGERTYAEAARAVARALAPETPATTSAPSSTTKPSRRQT